MNKWTAISAFYALNTFIIISVSANENSDDVEAKAFEKYGDELITKYKKDYLSAIFGNENSRQEFAKFINNHLTDEVKADLKAVRIFKKVGNVEMPVVSFGPNMDSWLGVLPQWKRVKKFIFSQMEAFVDLHPEILSTARPYLVPPFRKRGNGIIK